VFLKNGVLDTAVVNTNSAEVVNNSSAVANTGDNGNATQAAGCCDSGCQEASVTTGNASATTSTTNTVNTNSTTFTINH